MSITTGVVREVARWWEVTLTPASDPVWTALAEEAGWGWETRAWVPTAVDLVHEVGLHWYTWINLNYRAETDLRWEVAELFSQVIDHADVRALIPGRLGWTCCVGFQGSRPKDPDTTSSRPDEYYPDNTLLHQGGMVARRMVAAWAYGTAPTFVTWYTSMARLTESKGHWDLFSSIGLRNVLWGPDVLEPLAAVDVPERNFKQSEHAWRRPAWFTLRRLTWLRARASRADTIFAGSGGAVAVRFTARDGFAVPGTLPPSALSEDPARTYRFAYVCWADRELAADAAVAGWTLELASGSPADFAVVPLVPTVECDSPGPYDNLGFPDIEHLDWEATPRTSTVETSLVTGRLQIAVRPADPLTNPAPICVLCDYEVTGFSMRGGTEGRSGGKEDPEEDASQKDGGGSAEEPLGLPDEPV